MKSALLELFVSLLVLLVAPDVVAQSANPIVGVPALGVQWLKLNHIGENCTAAAFEAALTNAQCGAAFQQCMTGYEVLIKRYGQCMDECRFEGADVRSLKSVGDRTDESSPSARCSTRCRETYSRVAELALWHIGAAGEQCFVRVFH